MDESVDQAGDSGAIVGEADVTEADLAHALAQLPGSKRPWLVPVLLAVSALLSVGLNLRELSRGAMLTVVLPMGFLIVVIILIQRGVRRAWIKQALANIGGQTTFRFDSYGFASESSLRQHRLAWAGLARALETPQAFLVYTTPRTVLIVPKRAFSADAVVTLGQMLRERIEPARKAGLFGGAAVRMLVLWVVVVVMFLSIWRFLDEDNNVRDRNRGHRQHSVQQRDERRDGEASDVDSSP